MRAPPREVEIAPGVIMPTLAFGTFKLRGDACRDAVRDALATGFTHVDTATCYRNETDIRAALDAMHTEDAKKIFVTSKIAPGEMREEKDTEAAIEATHERLGRAPDLLLVHWPGASKAAPESDAHAEVRLRTWRVFERALRDGKCRAIGVSNFEAKHLMELLKACECKPAVNQIELHPAYPQSELRKTCAELGVHVQAYSPLGCGELIGDSRVEAYANALGLASAPALIRWPLSLQPTCSVVAKSSARARTEENFSALSPLRDDVDVGACVKSIEEAFQNDRRKFCWDPAAVK